LSALRLRWTQIEKAVDLGIKAATGCYEGLLECRFIRTTVVAPLEDGKPALIDSPVAREVIDDGSVIARMPGDDRARALRSEEAPTTAILGVAVAALTLESHEPDGEHTAQIPDVLSQEYARRPAVEQAMSGILVGVVRAEDAATVDVVATTLASRSLKRAISRVALRAASRPAPVLAIAAPPDLVAPRMSTSRGSRQGDAVPLPIDDDHRKYHEDVSWQRCSLEALLP